MRLASKDGDSSIIGDRAWPSLDVEWDDQKSPAGAAPAWVSVVIDPFSKMLLPLEGGSLSKLSGQT